jgi:hypothetical protein
MWAIAVTVWHTRFWIRTMKDSWSKYLSKGNLLHLLEIVNGCLECDGIDSFTDLLCNLKKIAGFDAAICTCVEPERLPASLDEVLRPINHHCQKNLVNDHNDTLWYERCYKVDIPVQAVLSSLDIEDNISIGGQFGDGRLNIVIPQSNDHLLSDGWVYGIMNSHAIAGYCLFLHVSATLMIQSPILPSSLLCHT